MITWANATDSLPFLSFENWKFKLYNTCDRWHKGVTIWCTNNRLFCVCVWAALHHQHWPRLLSLTNLPICKFVQPFPHEHNVQMHCNRTCQSNERKWCISLWVSDSVVKCQYLYLLACVILHEHMHYALFYSASRNCSGSLATRCY